MCRGRADSPDDLFGELGGGRVFAPSILNSSNGSTNVLPRLACQNAVNGSLTAAVLTDAFHETKTADPHFEDLIVCVTGVPTSASVKGLKSAVDNGIVDVLSLGSDFEMIDVVATPIAAYFVADNSSVRYAAIMVYPHKTVEKPAFSFEFDYSVAVGRRRPCPDNTAIIKTPASKRHSSENSISAHRPVLGIELLGEVLLGDVVSVDLERHGSVLSTLINATNKVACKPSSVNPPRVRGVCGTAGRRPGACISSSRVFSYPA